MRHTRVVAARIPSKVRRRIEEIAERQETTLTIVVETALTEFAQRFKEGEEIVLVRRAG